MTGILISVILEMANKIRISESHGTDLGLFEECQGIDEVDFIKASRWIF
jgi:hypothetical protein